MQRFSVALMYPQNGDLTKLLKLARKKSAPECPNECGEGGQILFGQCPNVGDVNPKGSSLNTIRLTINQDYQTHQTHETRQTHKGHNISSIF